MPVENSLLSDVTNNRPYVYTSEGGKWKREVTLCCGAQVWREAWQALENFVLSMT